MQDHYRVNAKQDPIIKEVGEEFGLSYQEAKEMYDQYWMEYVAKELKQLKWENVYIQGLGMFSARKANFQRAIEECERNGNRSWLLDNMKKTIEFINISNSKRKKERVYG